MLCLPLLASGRQCRQRMQRNLQLAADFHLRRRQMKRVLLVLLLSALCVQSKFRLVMGNVMRMARYEEPQTLQRQSPHLLLLVRNLLVGGTVLTME